jgi:hypothetical protein
MKPRLVRGMDVSNYQPANITGLIQQHKPEYVVVRLSTEDTDKRAIAHYQLEWTWDCDCPVSGYIWCYWGLDPEYHVRDALSILKTVGMAPDEAKVIWLDAEDPPSGDVVAWLRTAIKTIQDAGYRAGIYTGKWWWDQHLPNVTEFAHVPLWVAQYDCVALLDDVELFGGWTRAHGKQFSADGIDLDVFDGSVV